MLILDETFEKECVNILMQKRPEHRLVLHDNDKGKGILK